MVSHCFLSFSKLLGTVCLLQNESQFCLFSSTERQSCEPQFRTFRMERVNIIMAELFRLCQLTGNTASIIYAATPVCVIT